MMLVATIVLSFIVCFFCKDYSLVSTAQDLPVLELNPKDLNLVIGGVMHVNCSFCGKSRSGYNASNIAFNFTRSRTNELLGSVSAEDENCNENADWTLEEILDTDNETDVCNATQEKEEEGEENQDVFSYHDVTFQMNSKDIHIIDEFRAELRYPSVDERFHNGRLTCYLSPNPNVRADAHILVGERPYMPVITDVVVRNWRRIEFSWKTVRTAKTYVTPYRAWYRNINASEEFTECRLQPKTTPPPDFSTALGTWKRCLTFCVANIRLSFLRDPMTSVFVLKVNSSNVVGSVTSEEKIVKIYDILIPDPVLDLSVLVVNFSICVTFRSPQRDATLDYKLLFNCNSKIYETIFPALKVEFFYRCISSLPSYSGCVVSVRTKPHGYGNWSELSGPKEFQTPERVPAAAPEVCRSCFEVAPSKESGDFLVKVFFKSLPRELARGRIDKYRLRVRGYNSETMTVESQSLPLTMDGLNSSSLMYNFSLSASTTVGYNESLVAQPLTLNPVRSYELKNKIRNVTAFILNRTTVHLSWSCLEPSDGKNFFVFWCKGEIACQDEIHSLRVPPGANRQNITIAANMEIGDFLHGVAFETKDGHSSGISWSHCLHNLSQVCLSPKLDKEFNGASLRLKFRLENICYGGYPYAFNVSYCSLEAGNEIRNCRDTPVVIVVNSSDKVYEIGQLPSRDRQYLFMASCLTVAGPSLSPSQMILDPVINPSFDTKVFLVVLLVPAVVVVFLLLYRCKSNFTHIQIAFPRVVVAEPGLNNSCDAFDQISPYADCATNHVPPIAANSSSGHSSNGSLMRNGNSASSMYPLFPNGLGYRKPFSSTSSDPCGPGDSEVHGGSGGSGVGDTSAGSVYRAVGSITLKIPDELMMSPPVTDLKSVEEDFSPECSSVAGSETSRDQRTSGIVDSGYAYGCVADRSQSGSCHSLGVDDSAVRQVEVQSSPNCAFISLPISDKDTDGEIGDWPTVHIETNLNDEDGDDGDDDDDDDDDPYRCSSGGYATTRLRDKEVDPLLDTVASKPIMSCDSSSGDDDDDDSSSSCPYAAVTFCDKPVLKSSIDMAEISNSS